jgi:hypothetical protein
VSPTESSTVRFEIRKKKRGCNTGGVLGVAYPEVLYDFQFSQNIAGTMRVTDLPCSRSLPTKSLQTCSQHWNLNVDEITIDIHPACFLFSEAQLTEDTVVEFQEWK